MSARTNAVRAYDRPSETARYERPQANGSNHIPQSCDQTPYPRQA